MRIIGVVASLPRAVLSCANAIFNERAGMGNDAKSIDLVLNPAIESNCNEHQI